MNTNHTAATEAQVKQASEIIYDYIDAAEYSANAGPLEEHLFWFFGGWKFDDNITAYKMLCFDLLKALARPEVGKTLMEAMGKNYQDFLQMIDRLHSFCHTMEQDQCKAPIAVFEIKNYEVSEDKVERISEKYTSLLAGLKHGQKLKELIKNS